jgi:uncharacterized protein (DUF488 family)
LRFTKYENWSKFSWGIAELIIEKAYAGARAIGVARCFESEGFRAYATYLTLREDVISNLESVESIARSKTATLLCSERMPWRCHRKILADYFLARGFCVLHILEREKVVEHQLSKCAEIVENRLVYK